MTKKKIILLVAGVVVIIIAAVVLRLATFRAEDDVQLPSLYLRVAVAEQNDQGEYFGAAGTINISGDCAPIDNTGQPTAKPGKLSQFAPRGNVRCLLLPSDNTGGIERRDGEYLISNVSFFSRKQARLLTLPITGTNSLSPLRLTQSTILIAKIASDGKIEVTTEKGPISID